MPQFNQLKSKIVQALGLGRNPSQSQIGVDHASHASQSSELVKENASVFAEFRQVTVMLSLLAAINSGGRQVLDSKPYEADRNFDAMPASLERTQPAHRLVMTALSILLVRNNEVVAVTAATDLGPGPETFNHRATSPPDSNLQDLASREASLLPESDLAKPGLVDFIAVRNPEWFNELNNSPLAKIWKDNPNAQYMVLPTGTSRWEVVLNDAWSQKNKTVQYEDHAATLQDYLTYYQAIERQVMEDHGVDVLTPKLKSIVAEKRIDAFDSFTRYILSTSSPKMRARDKHRLSQRYLSCLCLITEEKLKSALLTSKITINEPTRTRDIPLCDALLASDSVFEGLEDYIRTQFPNLPSEFNFGTLRSAFERLRKFNNSGEADMSKCPSIYTKDTAVEFHYLLLTSISAYKAALKCLGSPTDEKGTRYTADHYNLAYMFVHLLWRVAHSSILREHLTLLHTAGLLSVYHQSGKVATQSTRDGDGAAEIQAADVVDAEMTSTQLHGKDGSLDLGIAILRWLRLLVSPVTAVETISLSCVRVQQQQCPKFRVQLVDVAPVRCNRFEWGPVIERALRLHPQLNSCVKDVIEMIDERAKGDLGPAQRTHLREFGGQAFVTEKGVPHCEFVTACLLRDLKRAIPVKGRDLIFDVGRHQGISVSRLCCPVCWEYLRVVDPHARYGVRGFHLKMFPVQLPPWTPENVAEQMLRTFRQKICDEVLVMLDETPKTRVSISSAQSVGSLAPSVASNLSVTSGAHTMPHRKLFASISPARLFRITPFSVKILQN